ncbi:hypothetical protein [Methylomonas koyamae]|uniref:hypothetical protein n=1 Tax=Methylomonas koyamae TaxID=702114 RepID=UPI002872CEE9|nr:hypothetical protein [Methylomonas koyamae]WNB75367.1 hypothetical protein RI210_19125 [Methylomonas koyamae]
MELSNFDFLNHHDELLVRLAKAFRGELVPQAPNDEPAAELLKRIQAERTTLTPPRRQRNQSA